MSDSLNLLAEAIDTINDLTKNLTLEVQKVLEETTASTGKTLDWIASNPVLKATDNIVGLNWLTTFLGKVDKAKVRASVAEMRSRYPQETDGEIAHRLIVEKAWSGGRLGLLTNIIPPVAALLLGIELVATTKLQTEMVYEIAAAYGLDLDEPTRRGEVLAIFGLSLGADVLKTGLNLVEILPGIGPVVGASTNAAMLYVLGQTACRFYEGKIDRAQISAMQQETERDWQVGLEQSIIMDRILAHMVRVSYPERDWAEILTAIEDISPSSVKTIAVNLEQSQDLEILLQQLEPEFAPLTLSRCDRIARANGEITSQQQEILSQIAFKFDLDLSRLN
jgi:uncharacterized protein (DUF697 family)